MSVQNLIRAAKEALEEWHQGCSSAVNVAKLEEAIAAAEKALEKEAAALRLAGELAEMTAEDTICVNRGLVRGRAVLDEFWWDQIQEKARELKDALGG